MDAKFWRGLILMSATPYVSLLVAARYCDVPVEEHVLITKRKHKRLMVYVDSYDVKPESIPPKTVVFMNTGMIKDMTKKDMPTVRQLKNSFVGRKDAFLVHPNYCFGWNPGVDLTMGVINFSRSLYSTTNKDGVIKRAFKLDPEYETVIQAMGRLSRYADKGAFLFLNSTASYTPLRYQAPRATRDYPALFG
jgi:hypothetical protein